MTHTDKEYKSLPLGSKVLKSCLWVRFVVHLVVRWLGATEEVTIISRGFVWEETSVINLAAGVQMN